MKTLLTLSAILMTVAACSDGKNEATGSASEGTEQALVYTTNYPLQYFAQRIAASVVDVRFLAPEGEDPAEWKPRVEDVVAMQKATEPVSQRMSSSKLTDRFAEVEAVLGPELASSACQYWSVTDEGNFEGSGRSVLALGEVSTRLDCHWRSVSRSSLRSSIRWSLWL